MRCPPFHALAAVLLAALCLPPAGWGLFVNFEGKQTRPVCLSADGTRLVAVNTPDARLSVFDVSVPANPILVSEIPVGLEPGSVNLVARGVVDGDRLSLLYDPVTGLYAGDTTGVGPYTRSQLLARITGDAAVTVLGVPPGTGTRLAHDRDEDGVADGDAVPPALDLDPAAPVVSWPTNDFWYVLEATDNLRSGTWSTVTEERYLSGGEVVVTNDAPDALQIYRLRQPW